MNKYIAELIGTYALVFCGTGAVVMNEVSGGAIGHFGISCTFGFIVIAMIYALGDISGAHLNPAVTIAFTVAKKFPLQAVFPYILAQTIGAILASLTLRLLFPDAATLGETLPSGTALQSFVLEIILSFLLMFVIIHVATGSKEVGTMAGIAIGVTVLLEAMFAGVICGASMNPARSFAPALVNLNFNHLWVYLTAPIIGTVISIFAWKLTTTKAIM